MIILKIHIFWKWIERMTRQTERKRSFQDESLTAEMVSLRRYALSLTRDRDGAEDLVQASVVRALSRAHQFQSGTNLRAWLFTIARNEFISQIRSARNRGPHISLEDAEYFVPCKASQEGHVELQEVGRAIMLLPSAERGLLGRIACEGQSYAEAAIALNVAVGTVKSRVARTRERLRLGDRLHPATAMSDELVVRHRAAGFSPVSGRVVKPAFPTLAPWVG